MSNLSWDAWAQEWADEIEQIQAFTTSDLPTTPGEIQADLNRTTREYPRASELLADVEQFLVNLRAHHTLEVKKAPEFEDLAAPERKTIVESRLSGVSRVRDVLAATCRALQQRSFALLNQRRFEEAGLRMSGRGEG